MLTLTGAILNWIAVGVIFPLMFLPLAALASGERSRGIGYWFVIVGAVVAAGVLFAALAPILRITPSSRQSIIFIGLVIALGAVTFAIGGPQRLISILTPKLHNITRLAGRIVMWLLIVMALVQFSVVVLRYVFGINYIFMQESFTYMHGAVFLLAGGYALLTDDHVRVDIFYREASPKRKALVDFLGTYLFLFPICLLLLWTASPYVGNSWSVGEGSQETSGIQGVFLLKSFIPAFAVLLAMAGFVIAGRAAETLRERS